MYNYDFSWDRPEAGIENLPIETNPGVFKSPAEASIDLTGGAATNTPYQLQAGQSPWGTLGRFDQPGVQGKWVTGYNEVGGGDAGSQLVEKRYWDYGNPNVKQAWDFGMGWDSNGGPNLTNSGTGDELVDKGGVKYLRVGNWQDIMKQQQTNPNPLDAQFDWSKLEYDPLYGYIIPRDAMTFKDTGLLREAAPVLAAALPALTPFVAPALASALGISQGVATTGFNIAANAALNGGRVNPLSALQFGGQLFGVPQDILNNVSTAGKIYNTYNQITGGSDTQRRQQNSDAQRRAAYERYLRDYYAKLGGSR